jgi:hypothetical protein
MAGWAGRRGRRGDDAGYSIVEAVITLPTVIILTMLVVQFAMLWHGRHIAHAAAEEGLRVGRGYQSTAAAGQSQADKYLQELAPRMLSRTQVAASRDAATMTVRVRAHVLSVVPFGSFDVDETASAPVERFVAPSAGG